MATYEAQVDGKRHKIELMRTAHNALTAKIDEKQHMVRIHANRLGSGQPLTIELDDKTYEVELPRVEQQKTLSVRVDEATFQVEVKISGRKEALTSFAPAPLAPVRKAVSAEHIVMEGAITAPMTGKIVKIKVKRGDSVKPSQILCVIEAMKMENEIAAPRAGTVQEVCVSEGSPVNEGDTLLVIG
jgi:biotin carboxyl carrier protein